MGLLNQLGGFANRVNGLLFPGFQGAGVDPQTARMAQSQAMMAMGAGLLGGANAGASYGAGLQAGFDPIEQYRRNAVLLANAANQQSEVDYRKWQQEQAAKQAEADMGFRVQQRMWRREDQASAQKQQETENAFRERQIKIQEQNARQGQQYAPSYDQVVLANGNIGSFNQRTGQIADTGQKAAVKGQAPGVTVGPDGQLMVNTAGAGLNDRQQAGLNTQKEALLNYVSNLTGTPRSEVDRVYRAEGAAAVGKLVKDKGKRALQGAPARILGALPFGSTAVDALNSDLIAARTAGGAGIAQFQNPTGPITTPDFLAGERQMPQPEYPLDTQASIIEQGLAQAERMTPNAGIGAAQNLPDPLGLRGK